VTSPHHGHGLGHTSEFNATLHVRFETIRPKAAKRQILDVDKGRGNKENTIISNRADTRSLRGRYVNNYSTGITRPLKAISNRL
jgi:hypothetical protein